MTGKDQGAAPVDWNRWRKCPQCGAAIGKPCADLTGAMSRTGMDRTWQAVEVPIDKPHGGRRPRTGGA